MSAICGILNLFSEDVVSCFDLDLMMQSLAHRGGDGSNIWNDHHIGLGQQKLNITPESICENLPFFQSDNNLTIVSDARLDNRTELFGKLGIPQTDKSVFADSRLILSAYEKWGERCPEYLLGDFTFAIWDGREKKLYCSRDHMGANSLFYYSDTKRFIFATEPKAILATQRVEQKINRNKLASLVIPSTKSFFWDESWFEQIYPLQAGCSLTVDMHGIRKRKYWEPPFHEKLPYKTDEEILEAFQSLMFEAVDARLRSVFPVTAMLSGGLDSSSVVSVAARILEKQNKQLHAYSAVLLDEKDASLKDERYFINQFLDWKNVKIHYITDTQRGPFDNVEQLVWHYDSPLIMSSHYLYTSFANEAHQIGSRVILDGSGGEMSASFHGEDCYAELFLRFHWLFVLKELRLRKKIDGDSFWRIFRSHILKPFIPGRLISKNDNFYKAHHILQKDYAKSLISQISSTKKSNVFSKEFLPNHRRSQHRLQVNHQLKKSRSGGTIGFGQISVFFPLLDKRLLEFCLAVPATLKVRDGYKRYLIRAGLDKILPTEIQWRNSKGSFSPDYLRRYNSQRKQVHNFLQDIKPNDTVRYVVDVEKLKELASLPVAENEAYTFAEIAARDLVPQGIYLIQFLRRFSEFQN